MLDEEAASTATLFWASHLGCTPQELFAGPSRILTHAPGWADYHGAFALFRGEAGVASIPPTCADALRPLLSGFSQGCSPERFAAALAPIAATVIGPAYTGYATAVSPPEHPVRALGPDDASALRGLQRSCDPVEWEHGGSPEGRPASGVFVGGELAALAGYTVWGDSIAHLSALTHPAFCHRHYGRSTVAHLAERAAKAGLLPQYQTLESNRSSVRLATSIGFRAYASSVSVRLKRGV